MLALPLDVERTKTVRSGPSGSADHAGLHAQGRVAVPLTLPLDVERTETVRSGPSGSAIHMELHAQTRVAVPPTLPLDGERTGSTPSHCHSTSSVPRRCAQGRVAVPPSRRAGRPSGTTAGPGTCSGAPSRRPGGLPTTRAPGAWGTGETSRPQHVGPFSCGVPGKMPQAMRAAGRSRVTRLFSGATDRAGCRERGESDERREAPERAKRVWLKREESPAGRQREVREGPAPDRSHTGCGPGLPDGRGDANAAQKSMSTLLKNKFHSLSSGHIV